MVDTHKGGERPRFRQDLVAEAIEDSGKKFVDVADPDNGSVFRFYEVEYALACAMDGERDLAGIVRWAQEDLGLHTNPNEVRSVVATLGELGFLESAAAARAAAQPLEPSRTVTPQVAIQPPIAAKPAPTPNKWDQPTAMGDSDEYLGKGVVTASKSAKAPVEDVELGSAGSHRPAAAELPKAGDFELGAPGGVRSQPEKTIGTQEIPLGSPGRAPDVSTDLSADMSVNADDVKEAVRASQVMKAVDVPKDLLESVEPVVSSKEVPHRADSVETKVEQPQPKARPEPRPEPRHEPKAKPPIEAVPAKAPPAPAPRVSPVLLVLLVLVVIGAGAFAVWKLVLDKSNQTEKASVAPPVQPKPPEPPPPPPVESEKLASEQPPAEDIKAPSAGTLEMVAADGSEVKAGAVIAALVGHKPIETEISNLQKDVDKRQAEVTQAEKDRDAAEAAGNKPGVTAAEKKIDDRKKALDASQAKLAAKTADLGKLVVKAASDGKVSAVGKANAKVTPNDVVAKLTPPAELVATFKTTSQPVTADAHVLLAIKGTEQKLACKVVAVDNGTKIACPHDAASEGTEVTFAGIDTSAPKEIEMDEGSAAGSGSAAAPEKPADKPAPTPAPAKAPPPAPPRPRPQPKPPTPAVDKGSAAAEKPADKPADKPAGDTGTGSAQP